MQKKIDAISSFILFLAIALGAAVRLMPVLAADFPINDGGMFTTMIREVMDNGFRLPVFTSYNAEQIPFTYPPLSFYLTGLIHLITHIPVISLVQYLPAFVSILTIPAFYKLSKTITGSRTQAAFAVLAFALLGRAFTWIIMGGGISRSIGFLFCILALDQIFRLFKENDSRFLIPAIVFASLTVLSHPEIAWFTFCSAFFFGLWYGRSLKGMFHAGLVLAGVAIFTAIWWVPILHLHGLSPWVAAFQVGERQGVFLLRILLLYFTGEPYTDLLAAIAILGILGSLANKKYLLPLWVLFIYLLAFRNEPYMFMLPVPMLVGVGLDWVVLPGLIRSALNPEPISTPYTLEDYLGSNICRLSLGVILAYALISSTSAGFLWQSGMSALPAQEREAMVWIRDNTPVGSRFLVITGKENWEIDSSSEWFPTLSERISLATVQGSEWLPDGRYAQQQAIYEALQSCAQAEEDCLKNWSEQNDVQFDYIFITTTANPDDHECCLMLLRSINRSTEYEPVYTAPGGDVYHIDWIP